MPLEEHVLGTAEADTLGAERDRIPHLLRQIGIGADIQPADTIGP
jgi:hypothetical protein